MADKESQGIAQAVVQDDDQQDDARTVEDSIAAGSDDAGDEEGNSQGRNSRQVIRSRISQLRQEALDDEAQSDGTMTICRIDKKCRPGQRRCADR